MTKLKVTTSVIAPELSKDTVIVVAVSGTDTNLKLEKSTFDSRFFKDLNLSLLGVSAQLGKITKISGPKGSVVAMVGLGNLVTTASLRDFGGTVSRELGLSPKVIIDIPLDDQPQLEALVEGVLLGNYEFLHFRPTATKRKLSSLTVMTKKKLATKVLAELEATAASVHACRDLVNRPANDLYPESFVTSVKLATKGLPLKVKIWDERALAAAGLGGILAVGKGSIRPPRLIRIEYSPVKASKSIAFVGKGITFDTGGLTLKPGPSMVGMKYDMTGAASCMQAVISIAEQRLSVKAVAWLCLAENMASGSATRPNDIIKIRNGKTVEVLNTDAEGRLVLADGLSMASEENPDYIIDVATLTGAAVIALGERYAGLMGDEKAVTAVQKAASTVGELVWHMPLPEELRSVFASEVADLTNASFKSKSGGMLSAAIFLREFVGNPKFKNKPHWAHLDIAGPANNDSAAYGHTPKGATGVIVRTLVQLAKQLSD